jgi:hypothetical protein
VSTQLRLNTYIISNNEYCRSEHHCTVDDDDVHDLTIRVHCVVSAQKIVQLMSFNKPLCSFNSDTILQEINIRGNVLVLHARQGHSPHSIFLSDCIIRGNSQMAEKSQIVAYWITRYQCV